VGWLGQQARWASRPGGLNWPLPIEFNSNFKIKFKYQFLYEINPNSKVQIILIKHFLYSLMK
jgi:hypothetical protein